MVKSYSFSKLLSFEEFDAKQASKRYRRKEEYFLALYGFTFLSEKFLSSYKMDKYNIKNIDFEKITKDAEMLQKSLANIGAVDLMLSIQNMNFCLKKKEYDDYLGRLEKIISEIENLRKKVVSAEKESSAILGKDSGNSLSKSQKYKSKARRDSFGMLLMLIDNFELDSAAEIAASIMRFSYTPEIDESLVTVCKALEEFNYDVALSEAKKLFEFVSKTETDSTGEQKRILAIDDMPDVLRTIKAMLKDKYSVFGVTDYDSAIKFLDSNTADLILLDIEMPGFDGFAMLQMFRKLPEYTDTPIIFLTSNISEDNIRMAAFLGANDFIKKPVDLAALLKKLEKAFS